MNGVFLADFTDFGNKELKKIEKDKHKREKEQNDIDLLRATRGCAVSIARFGPQLTHTLASGTPLCSLAREKPASSQSAHSHSQLHNADRIVGEADGNAIAGGRPAELVDARGRL